MPKDAVRSTCPKVPVRRSHHARGGRSSKGRCVNSDCPARLKETVRHYAARGVMDIDGMGESRGPAREQGARQERSGYLQTHSRATDRARANGDEIGGTDSPRHRGVRETAATSRAERARHPVRRRAHGAAFSRRIWQSRCASVADADTLQRAQEVGPKVAQSIHAFFSTPHSKELVEHLRAADSYSRMKSRSAGGLTPAHVRGDGHAAQPEPRGSQRDDRSRGRQSYGLGKQKDELCRRRREGRLETRQGQQIGRTVIDEAKLRELAGAP